MTWLIDERKPLTPFQMEELDRELADTGGTSRGGGASAPTLAVLIHDVTIHDNRKWCGAADVRLDALVVTGPGPEDPQSFYMPKTVSFKRVCDGARLPIGDGGLLVFYGPARHFLNIYLMVSRDRKDTQELAAIMGQKLGSSEVKGALTGVAALAVSVPTVGAVAAGVSAAAALGDVVCSLLQAATGETIGVYTDSHLEFRDNFGIGPHPGPGRECFRANELSFRYEIICADPAQ